MDNLKTFLNKKQLEYYFFHPVQSFVTLGVGGKVSAVVVVKKREDLTELLTFLHNERNLPPWVILGGGSNVAFPDGDSRLLVIVNRCSGMEKIPGENLAILDSGVLNRDFIAWAGKNEIGNLDFLAGIPGAVGGAAAVNAGSFGQSISMFLEKATVFNRQSAEVCTITNEDFRFRYRDSRFKYGEDAILQIWLRYETQSNEEIKKKVYEKIDYRKKNHPPSYLMTAGCFFKNPVIDGQKIPAGRLIENAGFKGRRIGPMEISPLHANFVINTGGGAFSDIRRLEDEIVSAVACQKGVRLEREVIYIGPDGKKS